MFTINQLTIAHGKVKSGADFPVYIRELIALGVTGYDTHDTGSHTEYEGIGKIRTSSPPKYNALDVANTHRIDAFKADLLAQQQGRSDYPAILADGARPGIYSWMVDMGRKTCTYMEQTGHSVPVEVIPDEKSDHSNK